MSATTRLPRWQEPRWRVLLGVYLVGVLLVVTTPIGGLLHRITVWLYVLFLYRIPVFPPSVLPEHYGVALNVLLFIPLGFLLAQVLPRRWQAAAAAVGGSLLIEGTQLLLLPRVAELVDVVANGLGGLVGVALAATLSRRRGRRAPARPAGAGNR